MRCARTWAATVRSRIAPFGNGHSRVGQPILAAGKIACPTSNRPRQPTRARGGAGRNVQPQQSCQAQPSTEESESLRYQIGTSNEGRGGRCYLPYAFTEHGVVMLSSGHPQGVGPQNRTDRSRPKTTGPHPGRLFISGLRHSQTDTTTNHGARSAARATRNTTHPAARAPWPPGKGRTPSDNPRGSCAPRPGCCTGHPACARWQSPPSMSILMKSTRGSFNAATSLSIVVSGTRTLGCADSGHITTLLAAKLVSSRFSVRVSSLSHTPFGYTITRPPAVSAARLRRMHSTLEGEISIETTVCAPASSAWRVKSPSLAPQSSTTSPAGP